MPTMHEQPAENTERPKAPKAPETPETPETPDARNWQSEALAYAERIGVYEYKVNGKYMEYWSFYGQGEGWYFVRYDLEAGKEVFRGANIPWDPDAKIPAFLLAVNGGALYNYMEG